MSVQLRKKSHSVSNNNINSHNNLQFTQRTINKNKKNQISTSRSVSAFVQPSQTTRRQHSSNTSKFHTNPTSKQIQKFSIQNKKIFSTNNHFSNTSYKQAIQKRKKSSLPVSTSQNKNKINQQLFIMIDTFQQALCSLPLQKLILGNNPFQWVQEQQKTLQKLKQNFIKIQQTLKIETKQYYFLKIENIVIVLKNIKQNLCSLEKLKNYHSGGTSIQSSLESRNSQSSSSIFTTVGSNQVVGRWNNVNSEKNFHKQQVKANQVMIYKTQHQRDDCSQAVLKNQCFGKIQQNENKQNCQRLSNLNRKQLLMQNNCQYQSNPKQKFYVPNIQSYPNQPYSKKQEVNQRSKFVLNQQHYKSTSSNNEKNHQLNTQQKHKFTKYDKSQNAKIKTQQRQKSFYNDTEEQNNTEQNDQTKPFNQTGNENEFKSLKIYDAGEGSIQMEKERTATNKNKISMNKTVVYNKKSLHPAVNDSKSSLLHHQQQQYKQSHIHKNHLHHSTVNHQSSKQTFNTMPNQQNNFIFMSTQQEEQPAQELISSSMEGYQNVTKRRHDKQSQKNDDMAESRMNKLNKKINSYTKEIERLKAQISIKNGIIRSVEEKWQKLLSVERKEFGRKEKQYLETIYQLKKDNEQKEKGVKDLLMRYQTKNDQIQLVKRQLCVKNEKYKNMEEKVVNLEKSLEHTMKQLKTFKIRQQQLRQTVHLQRQRTKKLQSQLQKSQSQLQHHLQIIFTNQSTITTLKQQNLTLSKKIQKLQKQSQKQLQKQQIYKLKYFKLMTDYQKFKSKINNEEYYWQKICLCCKKEYLREIEGGGKESQKQIQFRELIKFHKKKLLDGC